MRTAVVSGYSRPPHHVGSYDDLHDGAWAPGQRPVPSRATPSAVGRQRADRPRGTGTRSRAPPQRRQPTHVCGSAGSTAAAATARRTFGQAKSRLRGRCAAPRCRRQHEATCLQSRPRTRRPRWWHAPCIGSVGGQLADRGSSSPDGSPPRPWCSVRRPWSAAHLVRLVRRARSRLHPGTELLTAAGADQSGLTAQVVATPRTRTRPSSTSADARAALAPSAAVGRGLAAGCSARPTRG